MTYRQRHITQLYLTLLVRLPFASITLVSLDADSESSQEWTPTETATPTEVDKVWKFLLSCNVPQLRIMCSDGALPQSDIKLNLAKL